MRNYSVLISSRRFQLDFLYRTESWRRLLKCMEELVSFLGLMIPVAYLGELSLTIMKVEMWARVIEAHGAHDAGFVGKCSPDCFHFRQGDGGTHGEEGLDMRV
jgi:hypothetical protein